MSYVFERFYTRLKQSTQYSGYPLAQSPEIYTPQFQLARELAHVMRSVYTLTFALLDSGLESVATALCMPPVLMESRIMRLGFITSSDAIFNHAHINFVAQNTWDWSGDESLLEHLAQDVLACADRALAKKVFHSADGVFAIKEIQLARDAVAPLLISCSAHKCTEEVGVEVEAVTVDPVAEEVGVEVETVAVDSIAEEKDPAWVQGITVVEYLNETQNVQRIIRKKFATKWAVQKQFDVCAQMHDAVCVKDKDTLAVLLATQP
jgi:hypothetical protein